MFQPLPNRHSMSVVPPPSAAAPTPSSLLRSSPPSTVVVKTDFVAGNYKELTVRKGEVLEVMAMFKLYRRINSIVQLRVSRVCYRILEKSLSVF